MPAHQFDRVLAFYLGKAGESCAAPLVAGWQLMTWQTVQNLVLLMHPAHRHSPTTTSSSSRTSISLH
jgi:hypothetical protein